MKNLALFIVLSLAITAYAENWAVLVAGSDGFWNYRHQADVCHAYKSLIRNGYKAENIITMAADDIAHSSQNPVAGKIFNKPTGQNPGENVYEGCVIDYRGGDVTPQNFLAVLRGDSAATGGKKVLRSTSNDRVFINFSDHGAAGLIAFPSSYLYANDLHPVFQQMKDKNMYKSLVFYLEACESGSMFEQLRQDIGIYALSASNPHESSWGYYCPPDDVVQGVSIGSCLGDHFSINWMEDTDKGDLARSLQQQFQVIKGLTTQSQVMQWGDLSFTQEPISHYLAGRDTAERGFLAKLKELFHHEEKQKNVSSWDSRDNKMLYLINKFKNTQAEEDLLALEEEFKERKYYDQKFTLLKSSLKLTGTYSGSLNNECLREQVQNFETSCRKLSDYGLKYVKYLSEMCDNSNLLQAHMVSHIKAVCEN